MYARSRRYQGGLDKLQAVMLDVEDIGGGSHAAGIYAEYRRYWWGARRAKGILMLDI